MKTLLTRHDKTLDLIKITFMRKIPIEIRILLHSSLFLTWMIRTLSFRITGHSIWAAITERKSLLETSATKAMSLTNQECKGCTMDKAIRRLPWPGRTLDNETL
jgi:hypothetical protein